MLSISNSSCLVGFPSSLISVRSHVPSLPGQTFNILHLGSSRCSVFRTMSIVASKFVLPCCLMGCVCFPTSLSSQIRRPWITCSSFTPVTSDCAGYTRARNVQHASLPSPSSTQTHTIPAIRVAISKLHLKVRKAKDQGSDSKSSLSNGNHKSEHNGGQSHSRRPRK
jgi:hypothetical protein